MACPAGACYRLAEERHRISGPFLMSDVEMVQGALLRTPARIRWLAGHSRGLRDGRASRRRASSSLWAAPRGPGGPAGEGRAVRRAMSAASVERVVLGGTSLRWRTLSDPVLPVHTCRRSCVILPGGIIHHLRHHLKLVRSKARYLYSLLSTPSHGHVLR
jgi:hypothetical protein